MKPITRYVGLDVHKSTISVAVAEEGRGGEVRYHGVVENRADVLIKLAERLRRRGERLRFCYEAGPCGYVLHRLLSGLGHDCAVVAPSLIPKKPGDRVKTNRRDAAMLARLHRAGELTAVWVPEEWLSSHLTRFPELSGSRCRLQKASPSTGARISTGPIGDL